MTPRYPEAAIKTRALGAGRGREVVELPLAENERPHLAAAIGRRVSNSTGSLLDDRSDNRGPEPEGVAVGTVAGTPYAFLGSKRPGSIYAYDLSDPQTPLFSGYANTRTADLGPEGVVFVSPAASPSGDALVLIDTEMGPTPWESGPAA